MKAAFPKALHRPTKRGSVNPRCVMVSFWVAVALAFSIALYIFGEDISNLVEGKFSGDRLHTHASSGGAAVLDTDASTPKIPLPRPLIIGHTAKITSNFKPSTSATSATPAMFTTSVSSTTPAASSTSPKSAVSATSATSSTFALPYSLEAIQAYAAAVNPELFNPNYTVVGSKTKGYLPDYASPCFMNAREQFRCLPQLLILGGFHSGANSMTHRVANLEGTVQDSSSGNQFWAEHDKSMEGYLNGFSGASMAIQGKPHLVLLDVSQSSYAYYLASGSKSIMPCIEKCIKIANNGGNKDECLDGACYPAAVKADMQIATNGSNKEECLDGACYPAAVKSDMQVASEHKMDYVRDAINPMFMRAMYGQHEPKLVIMLREPIARLHSAYYGYPHYFGAFGKNSTGFLKYVKEQVAAFQECSKEHGDVKCAIMFEALGSKHEKVYFHCDQILRSMHSVWMEGWLRFFPRSSILVIKSDEYFKSSANELRVLQDIARHAGLTEHTQEHLSKITAENKPQAYAKDHVMLPGAKKLLPEKMDHVMLPEAMKLLTDFFRPFNKRLAELLDDPYYATWSDKWA
eukprot:gene31207-6356_t